MSTYLDHVPDDGREYGDQCARCGSSVAPEDCEACGGDGYVERDFGDDVVPELHDVPCEFCEGSGGRLVCLSSREWCEANPLPDRADVKRGAIEFFPLPERTEQDPVEATS